MTFAAICPQCDSRWKILPEDASGDLLVRCPCCPPPGQLIAQTFEDVCPEQKDAA